MRYLFLLILSGCSTKQQVGSFPSGSNMSLDEAAKPVNVKLGAGDALGYQTFQEMSIFTPENITFYLLMLGVTGFLVWKEFLGKKR